MAMQEEEEREEEGNEYEEVEPLRFAQIGGRVVQEAEADVDESEAVDSMARIASLPPIKGPYDKGRMQLTHQEKTWALAIKEGIESEAEVDNLTDFWYAQLALICHDDVSNAIERAQQLQYLREEYNIVETYEFGRRCIHQAISLFPDYYLCLSFNHQDGNYVLVVDLTKLPMSTFRTNPNAVDIKVCEIYFMSHLMSPDFEAIRRGIICVAECEGYQMQHDIGVGIWRRVWDMVVPYPLNLQKIKHFHTGVMSNIMVSMVRQFLPRSIKDRIEVGCLSEAGRLDGMYLMPNKEAARKRTLSRLEDALQRRYNNEAAFKL